jgi:hypothetical protein
MSVVVVSNGNERASGQKAEVRGQRSEVNGTYCMVEENS